MKRKISMTILIIFVSFLAIYLGLRDTNKSNRDLYKLELKEEIKGNKFAIYVNNGGGYKEYNNKIWPNEYVFNSELSKCVDEYGKDLGNVLDFNEGTNTASVNTTQTAYCYLYFIYDITLPTCSLTVSGNDIIWNSKSDNFTESSKLKYTINTNSNNPSSYDNLNNVGIGVGTYYGYVQDEVGNIGKCEIDIRNTKPVACTVTQENQIPIGCTVTGENQIPVACNVTNVNTSTIYCKVTDTQSSPVYCSANPVSSSGSCNVSSYSNNYHNCQCDREDIWVQPWWCFRSTSCSNPKKVDVSCTPVEPSSCTDGVSQSCGNGTSAYTNKCTYEPRPIIDHYCEDGNIYSNESDCTSKVCGSTTYTCSDGSTCYTDGCCSSKTCSVTKYSCSNGWTYDTSYECTSKTCGTNYSYTCSNGQTYNNTSSCTSASCGTNYSYSCSNGGTYGTSGECTNITCRTDYTYSCSNNGVYNSREECTNQTCSIKYTYACSNGTTYDSQNECTSKTCGTTCDSGYTQTGSYCYK